MAELAIRLRGAVKRYGTVTALAGVDIDVRAGELLAVLGPNGAGKSTAISLWLGLAEADAGEVTLLGGAPQDVERRRGLGVVPGPGGGVREVSGAGRVKEGTDIK